MKSSNKQNSFRELENSLRKQAMRNDSKHLDFLEQFNDLLTTNPLNLLENSGVHFPNIFVLGVPRSGTTLLMQLLASGLDIGYPNCIIARFWKAPAYGIMLSQQLSGVKNKSSFNSIYGTPENLFEPHEFSYFWHYWMNTGLLNENTQRPYSAHDVDWIGFKNQIGQIQSCFNKPIAMKGLLAKGVLGDLAKCLPNTVFLYIERDTIDTAISLLEARKRYYNTEEQWWSMYPDDYDSLCSLSPVEQVVGQSILLDLEFKEELAWVNNATVIYIKYSELCVKPDAVLNDIRRSILEKYGINIPRKNTTHDPFQVRRKTIPADKYKELKQAFKLFNRDFPKTQCRQSVPYKKVIIPEDGIKSVNKLLRSGQVVTGKNVSILEKEISEFLGKGVDVACVSSGMAALEMILTTLGGNKRQVSIPSFTCEALALAVERSGASLNLLDVDFDTMNLADNSCAEDIIVAPHMFGSPAPINSIKAPIIIEDCAHSFGATINNIPCGTIGDFALLSFYATKLLPGIFGGAVISKDKSFIQEIRDIRQYNHRKNYKKRFQNPMSDISAEIVRSNLSNFQNSIVQKLRLAKRYDEAFLNFPIKRQSVIKGANSVWEQYVIKTKEHNKIIKKCKKHNINLSQILPQGIATRMHHKELENTKKLCEIALGIPIYSDMNDEEQEYIINTITSIW